MVARIVVALCVLALGCTDSKRLQELEAQNKALQTRLSSLERAASLDLQSKCAQQAKAVYKELNWEKEGLGGYSNHYNAKIGKCFVLLEAMTGKTTMKTLMDAFEMKELADYSWINNDKESALNGKPFMCRVTLPSGEEKYCDSSDGFYRLLKVYME